MKTLEITRPGEMRVAESGKPRPGNHEILLKIHYVGFCGSDLSTYRGKNTMVEFPRIPGHEISAVIEQVGADVPSTFKAGQKATVIPYTSCGQCTSCRQKRFNACRYNQTLGVQRDGAMAEYIVAPWQKVIADDELTAIQLALVEPLTVGFHAVDNGRVTDLDTVLVFGCGMIGAGAIVRAHLRGATVIAADINDTKLETARKLGADYTINSLTQNLHAELEKMTRGNGPSVVVEAAGNPASYRSAIEEAAFAGRVVCIGYAANDIAFPTRLWVQKELMITGSRNANPSDFEAVIKYLKKSPVDPSLLISAIVSPEEAIPAMQDWSENPGRIMKILVRF